MHLLKDLSAQYICWVRWFSEIIFRNKKYLLDFTVNEPQSANYYKMVIKTCTLYEAENWCPQYTKVCLHTNAPYQRMLQIENYSAHAGSLNITHLILNRSEN